MKTFKEFLGLLAWLTIISGGVAGSLVTVFIGVCLLVVVAVVI